MKILLLNENPVVSKLINLSAGKMSYELDELSAYNGESYDVIIVDSDVEVDLELLRQNCSRLIFLAPRNQTCEVEAEILYKPFLPTDFLNLLNNKADLEAQIIEDKNPYEDLSLDLDALNLDDLPDNNESVSESTSENKDEELGLEDLSFDDEGENTEVALSESIDKEELETEELNEQKETGENDEILGDNEVSEIQENEESEPEILIETEQNTQEEQIDNPSLSTSEEKATDEEREESLPIVEEQDKQMDFDDLPDDAEFLGQVKNEKEAEEIEPSVEENFTEEENNDEQIFSTQDQIKDELAQIDEMDLQISQDNGNKILEDFKDEPILDHDTLGVHDEELVVPIISDENDFDTLKEAQIKQALGESVENEENEGEVEEKNFEDKEEMIRELSQGIAGALNSSIKDDTLKAALKGMSLNININISFEDKH